MRLVLYEGGRLGAVRGEEIVDLTDLVPVGDGRIDRMRLAIERWSELEEDIAERISTQAAAVPLAEVSLSPPLPRPGKIVAAPANYREHTAEMVDLVGEQQIEQWVGFLKAPSSVIGPGDRIQIPIRGRRTDYEGELGVVVGHTARRVSEQDALAYVFGYVPLLDITIRGDEDRSFRKSADTFTPLGPAIVTADEVGEPDALGLRLWSDGDLRQDATTADLVWSVRKLIAAYSAVMTLEPGDLIATGTPAGVGPISPGTAIRLTIDRVGTLEVSVEDPAEET